MTAEAERTVRALVLEAPRRLVARTFALPEIGDDDALLRVEACGLCGTDHELWSGSMKKNLPIVPGHEAVGIVERIGAAASARWGVHEGDRVGVAPRQAGCMGDRLAARLDRRQLTRLGEIGRLNRDRIGRMSVKDIAATLNRPGDEALVAEVVRSGIGCLI